MSSTNKTTNYELSQFIGSDKPAWLTDYNSDMGKIDAGVAAAQSTATGADGKATANATAIGDLTSLTTTAKTNLVAAVNEINTAASTATNTASNAAGTATQAKNTADGLAEYLTMSNLTEVTTNQVIAAAGTVNRASITVATDNTHSYGKVYGVIEHIPNSYSKQTLTINVDTGIHPATPFNIFPAGIVTGFGGVTATFNTNGTITISYYPNSNTAQQNIYLWPCFYTFKDFGDE